MSSPPPLRTLLAMPDGSLTKEHWSHQTTQRLHVVLANLPAPPTGEGGFSRWRKATFLPACDDDDAAVLTKFTPQTLKPKVDQFYNLESPHASATPAKRSGDALALLDLLDLSNKPNSHGSAGSTPRFSSVPSKKAKTGGCVDDDDNVDNVGIDRCAELEGDVICLLDGPKPSTAKINRSGELPYMTTTFTNDAGKKHFVFIGMQVPRCAEVTPIITVTDRAVTVEVPSLVPTVDDATHIVNVLKEHAELSDEKARAVARRLTTTVLQQVRPWRYDVTAPFQLNPNDVKTVVKQMHVGTLTSKSMHDVIIVDIGQLMPNITNAVLYVDNEQQ